MNNYNFCFNWTRFEIFSQNCTLVLFNNPLIKLVLSPSIDKYFGLSKLVLSHVKHKSDEFGFLKSR